MTESRACSSQESNFQELWETLWISFLPSLYLSACNHCRTVQFHFLFGLPNPEWFKLCILFYALKTFADYIIQGKKKKTWSFIMFSLDLKGTGNLPCVGGEGDGGGSDGCRWGGSVSHTRFYWECSIYVPLFFFFCQGHVKDSRIPPINFFFLKKLLVMCQAFNILRADLWSSQQHA